jgi:glycosyltransferase involved in cell wall biosynthesis
LITHEKLQKEFPKITIITPSYNQGSFIEETILSVINQGYPNLEYIIIDGGSTDNTVEIIQQYQPYLSYWISEKDGGQSDAINKGLKIATGSIINWLNSDDIMTPGCLYSIAGYFNENVDADIVYGNILFFNMDKEIIHASPKTEPLHYYAHICMPQPATFFSRKIINTVGLIDEHIHFSMDWDLYVRASLAGFKFLHVPELFARFRIHGNSKSGSPFSEQFLINNAFIFYSVIKSIDPGFAFIDKLYNELGIDIPASPKTYKVAVVLSAEEVHLIIFYFLEHRCKTLFFAKDYKGLQHLVNTAKKYFGQQVQASKAMRSRYFISKLPPFVIRLLLKLRTRVEDLL